MKKRVVKKHRDIVEETLAYLDRILGVQYELDEANRFLGDLLVILLDRDTEHKCLEHMNDFATPIYREVCALINENRDLKERLAQNLQEDKPKIAN